MSFFEKLLSWLVGAAAVAVAITVVHREFFAVSQRPPTYRQPSSFVRDWTQISSSGRTIGDTGARVKVVEFMDLECPFCRRLNDTMHGVMEKYPKDVAYVFVHFPLPNHRFALPAARAVECVASAGRFVQMVDALYAKQDSFGLRPWSAYARSAGIRDTAVFQRCMSDTTALPTVNAGVEKGRRIGVQGTPTVILNGWRYGTPPSDTELVRAIGDLLAGRKPYPLFPTGNR